jgi:hypothetical protein
MKDSIMSGRVDSKSTNTALQLAFASFAILMLFSFFAAGGLFIREVPIVGQALTKAKYADKLKSAGIIQISRGYEYNMYPSDSTLYIRTAGGTVKLDVRRWDDPERQLLTRRYQLSAGDGTIKFKGSAPLPTEHSTSFLSVVEDDVERAIEVVTRQRIAVTTAAASWAD